MQGERRRKEQKICFVYLNIHLAKTLPPPSIFWCRRFKLKRLGVVVVFGAIARKRLLSPPPHVTLHKS